MTPMNPLWAYVTGAFIVLMMLSFIGIWIWAWRRYHLRTFDRMARLPMEDEPAADAATKEDRP